MKWGGRVKCRPLAADKGIKQVYVMVVKGQSDTRGPSNIEEANEKVAGDAGEGSKQQS